MLVHFWLLVHPHLLPVSTSSSSHHSLPTHTPFNPYSATHPFSPNLHHSPATADLNQLRRSPATADLNQLRRSGGDRHRRGQGQNLPPAVLPGAASGKEDAANNFARGHYTGGIETLQITETIGVNSGLKRHIAHTLCVSTQLPVSMHGGNDEVSYIDTEGTFSPDRIVPIAEGFGMDASAVLDDSRWLPVIPL